MGFAVRRNDDEPLSQTALLALRHWGIKFLVALLIAFGTLYFFNPFGQGASTVYGLLKYSNLFSKDSLPIYLEASAPGRRMLIGFLGWYLHLLGYFSYRLSRGDVASTRVYGIVFQHLLFVMGLSVSLPLEADSKLLFVIFLVGYLPLSGLGLLKQVLLAQLAKDDEEDLSAAAAARHLPLRCAEAARGGDSNNIPALLSFKPDTLRRLVPISPGMLDLWRGAASLIPVVGMARYKELRNHCLTGEEFCRRVQTEPAFRGPAGAAVQAQQPGRGGGSRLGAQPAAAVGPGSGRGGRGQGAVAALASRADGGASAWGAGPLRLRGARRLTWSASDPCWLPAAPGGGRWRRWCWRWPAPGSWGGSSGGAGPRPFGWGSSTRSRGPWPSARHR